MDWISYRLSKLRDQCCFSSFIRYQRSRIRLLLNLKITLIVVIGYLTPCNAAFAEDQNNDTQSKRGSLLIFPNIHIDHRSGLSSNNTLKRNDTSLNIDVFYSKDFGNIRVLSEVFISDDEQEVERIQLGWTLNPLTTLWFGRFHRPTGYWNSQYHHGTYLQSTVERPGIVEYEDGGGVLPTHTTGLMLENTQIVGEGAFKYYLTLGAGPEFNSDDKLLEALNVLDINDGNHKLSIAAKLSYRPDELGPTDLGLFAGSTDIPIGGTSFGEISQSLLGGYIHSEIFNIEITSALFNAHNDNEINGVTSTGSFSSAYLQGEYQLNTRWLAYSRIEGITDAASDPYLLLFSSFAERRKMLGVRYDFSRRQALTLELSRMSMVGTTNDHFHTSLQWSAVFP